VNSEGNKFAIVAGDISGRHCCCVGIMKCRDVYGHINDVAQLGIRITACLVRTEGVTCRYSTSH